MQTAILLARQVRLQRLAFALFIVMLSGMVGVYIALAYQHVRDTENEKLVAQANVVSTNIKLHMTSIDWMLEEVLALQSFVNAAQQRDHMQSLVNATPIIRAISVLDESGRQVAGTRDANNGKDFSGRPYYLNARSEPRPLKLHVSAPYLSVSGDVTIALSKAILGQGGRFQGVVVAAVEPDYLKELMTSTLYAQDMWATLLHPDEAQTIHVRGGMPGQPPSSASSEIKPARLPPPHNGRALIMRSHDGSARQLVASRNIAGPSTKTDLPLQIVTGRDYEASMADWRRFAYLQGGLLALFIIIATAGLLFGQRRLHGYAMRQAMYLRRIEDSLKHIQAQEQDYRIIVEHTSACIIRLDVNGEFSYANPAFCSLFGLSPDEIMGRDLYSLMAEDDIEPIRESVKAALQRPSERHFQAKFTTPLGTRDMEWTLCSVPGPEDTVRGVIGIGHDISAHISLHEKLRALAERDGLTGLFNRRYFMETATAQLAQAHRYEHPLSLLVLDLDHFKKVNDTHGHQAGDITLQVCARLMQHSSRESDLPARIGGEEFAILLPGTTLDEAVSAAERLRAMVEQHPIILEDGDYFHLTASFGVAALQAGEDIESLMRRADAALYTAKQNGRNRVETAQPPVTQNLISMPSQKRRPSST